MTEELAIKLKTLNRRVERLNKEIKEKVPSIIINQELTLVRNALDEIEAELNKNKLEK